MFFYKHNIISIPSLLSGKKLTYAKHNNLRYELIFFLEFNQSTRIIRVR